jgi:hypothetical protein
MTSSAWLQTVRIARDCGDISCLFPPGVKSIVELPYTLFNAIHMALYFLSFEELPKEERPPKRIWLNADLMEAHWEAVTRMRRDRSKGEDISDLPQNEHADSLLKSLGMK